MQRTSNLSLRVATSPVGEQPTTTPLSPKSSLDNIGTHGIVLTLSHQICFKAWVVPVQTITKKNIDARITQLAMITLPAR
jgi:hypothetical protein